jgi:uncharacterized protein (TIGR00251 family)
MMPAPVRKTSKTVLRIKVLPRAKKNQISQVLTDGMVKIRLTAPPVEGKANQALIRFLATLLKISPSNIELLSGKRDRIKVVSISGIDAETANNRILENMGKLKP